MQERVAADQSLVAGGYVCIGMSTNRPSRPRIEGVDAAYLFARAEETFSDLFEIERVVAATDIRALFVARHTVLKRRVALRVHFQPNSQGRRWFEREGELLASLDHPSLRPVFSAGYRGDWAYRTSKWIEGESLHEAVERGPRPIPAVLQIARDIISGLDYAHGERVIVRRIIPASLMLGRGGRAIITDLRWSNPCLEVAEPDIDPSSDSFLAPETRGGRPGEPASDVYTAGALIYFAVVGHEPAADPAEIVPPRTLREACPQALERIIMRALKADQSQRHFTAAEMGDDLLSDLGDLSFQGAAAPAAGAADDPAAWEKRLRRALGDEYELLDQLGSGAFGRVYLVRDLALERQVALKVLHPSLTADRHVVERFLKEAQLAAQLRHPNIVDVYDTGGRAGLLWYTMEYVRGENVAQLVHRTGPLPASRVVDLLEQGLSALQHAHATGLVHRDLKPENLLIEHLSGRVQITDFGLAVALDDRGGGASSRSGTPEFAAPEQLLGEQVDLRSDLYSLSIVALYALTGRPPFGGGSIEAVLARQAAGMLPEVRRDDVPDELLHVLAKGAARDPEDRFPSAEAYLQELKQAIRRARANPWRAFKRLFGAA